MIIRSLNQLRKLKARQYLSPNELVEHQEKKLRKLIYHAYHNVKYYRELFDSVNLKPGDIVSVSDLCKIPITEKKNLQQRSDHELIARGTSIKECITKYTSGSTGHPLKIIMNAWERDYQILLNLYILMENGFKLNDKLAYIINPFRFPKSKYWFQNLGILRREYLSVFDFPDKHSNILKKMNPDIIYGYPSNLTLLAEYIQRKKISSISPKMVFSVAEALEPKARDLINSVLGVSTCDILGTIELGDIAWQCEHRKGYHVNSDAVIIEYIKDNKPVKLGEEGKIVCTNLFNFTMPFIRYAVNDLCIPSDRQCDCGRSLPLIEKINGRANDFITLPDGSSVASCFLVITMQNFHDVAHYRVIQENKKQLRIQIVKGRGYCNTTGEKIKNEIERAVENKLQARIEIKDKIERDPSGKIRTVVSHILKD
ncbi:MAG: hypothetical protein ABIJ59_13290 [Pseudomonadota bacterium]